MNITEEEKKKFATGGCINIEGDATKSGNSQNESMSKKENQSVALEKEAVCEKPCDFIDNGIVTRCPETYLETRKNALYGEFLHDTYYSTTCKMERGFSILLPPSYGYPERGSEQKSDNLSKTYPVLYLLHGIFGDEFSFSNDENCRIKEILGNMSADGIIEETILVCPNMYATDDSDMEPGFSNEACIPYDNFINDLVTDLMPFIEDKYRVKTGRENTYLAGFSMGGRETAFIALKKPELFGYVCAISPAPGLIPTEDKYMKHSGQLKVEEVKFGTEITTKKLVEPNVFMLCCGTQDSVVGTFPKMYHEIFVANEVAHIWYEIPGVDHNNDAVQSGIYNILRMTKAV